MDPRFIIANILSTVFIPREGYSNIVDIITKYKGEDVIFILEDVRSQTTLLRYDGGVEYYIDIYMGKYKECLGILSNHIVNAVAVHRGWKKLHPEKHIQLPRVGVEGYIRVPIKIPDHASINDFLSIKIGTCVKEKDQITVKMSPSFYLEKKAIHIVFNIISIMRYQHRHIQRVDSFSDILIFT